MLTNQLLSALPLTSNLTIPAAFILENYDRIRSSIDQMNNGGEQCHNGGRKMLDRNTNELCRRCREINLPLLFEVPRGKVPLGCLHEIENKADCSFCRFVKDILRLQFDEQLSASFWHDCTIENQPVRCFLQDFMLRPYPDSQANRCGIYIKTEPELRFSKLYENFLAFDIPIFQVIATNSSLDKSFLHGRKIYTEIDTELPRRWLEICEALHTFHFVVDSQLRLIDLEMYCLVAAPQHCRYISLSYVWGASQTLTLTKSNHAKLQIPGALAPWTRGLARTIGDSISLVKSMQERYLWVDSLCIIQDDPEDVRVQLEVMDKVYRNAVLTIVACHGSDAESGLPGIQPASRSTKQIITEVEGRTLLSYTPDRWRAKRECKWETRGWTYQEKRLSSRLLYVTIHQVYFECKDACEFCEEIVQELNVTASSNGNPYLRRLYAPNEESFGAKRGELRCLHKNRSTIQYSRDIQACRRLERRLRHPKGLGTKFL